jgi:transcriptional regulator with XRE-family HTH domain
MIEESTKLYYLRVGEGWTMSQVARASGISPATLKRAESGESVREYVWGKILKGINSLDNKTRRYEMTDIRP